MKKKVTLVDIARQTGYSVNCVSRALMDADDISDNTKRIIKEVADELGYIPNLNAASLKKGKSKIIGILYDNILNQYYNTMIYYLQKELNQRGYCMIMYQSGQFDEEVYKQMVSRNIDGLISFLVPNDEVVRRIKMNNFNTVILGRKSAHISSVYYNDFKVGYIAGETLVKKGYKKPIYLGEYESISISKQRSEGFLQSLEDHNIVGKSYFRINEETFEEIISNILDTEKIDSIFCFNDLIAYEVLKVLNARKLKQVKVIGVDNIQAEIKYPFTITTIGHNKRKTIDDAIDILFKQMNSSQNEVTYLVEDVYLVE